MKKFSILIFFGFIMLSCQQLPTDVTPPPVESLVFKSNQLNIMANRQDATPNVPISITAKCFPLYSGNGKIKLSLLGGGRTVLVTSPKVDTLGPGYNYIISIPVNFTPNAVFTHNWTIILKDSLSTDYAFEGFVQMDSIMIDGKIFSIDSEEAKNNAPIGQHYHSSINSENVLVFNYK